MRRVFRVFGKHVVDLDSPVDSNQAHILVVEENRPRLVHEVRTVGLRFRDFFPVSSVRQHLCTLRQSCSVLIARDSGGAGSPHERPGTFRR
jgi:hypothetical protein